MFSYVIIATTKDGSQDALKIEASSSNSQGIIENNGQVALREAKENQKRTKWLENNCSISIPGQTAEVLAALVCCKAKDP
jgi:hypothetical protein